MWKIQSHFESRHFLIYEIALDIYLQELFDNLLNLHSYLNIFYSNKIVDFYKIFLCEDSEKNLCDDDLVSETNFVVRFSTFKWKAYD